MTRKYTRRAAAMDQVTETDESDDIGNIDAVEPMATTGETVTVALKHPSGVILEIFEESEGHEPVMGGGTRKVKVFRTTGKQYPINGNRVPFGMIPNYPIIGGYALTAGVPREVWEIWSDQHKDSPLIENGLIMAHSSIDGATSEARNRIKLTNGLEPMRVGGDPRDPKRKNREGKFVSAIEKADEQAAA